MLFKEITVISGKSGGYFFLSLPCLIRAIIPIITKQKVNNSSYVTIGSPLSGSKECPLFNEGSHYHFGNA
jgi:hypothetical protein